MGNLILVAVAVVIVIGALAGLLWLLNGKSVARSSGGGSEAVGTAEPPPFRRKDWLLTKGERAFFDVLRQAAGPQVLIFAKVRLEDLLWLPKGTDKRQTWRNQIKSRHIDFVLCSEAELRPLLAIELDDASHEQEERRERDGKVDAFLKAAGLLRIKARAGYTVEAVRRELQVAIAPATETARASRMPA